MADEREILELSSAWPHGFIDIWSLNVLGVTWPGAPDRIVEKIGVLLITAVALALSSLPYLSGYTSQTDSQVFSGAVVDRPDYAVHLATIQAGMQGDWAYRFRFTSETQRGAYVKLAYIFIGQVARLVGIGAQSAYHVSRLALGFFCCMSVYWLVSQAFTDRKLRLLAFSLAIFASGLGWLQLLFSWAPRAGPSPVDFWLIDAYIFFGILAFPHFSAVTGLLVCMIAGYVEFQSGISRPLRGSKRLGAKERMLSFVILCGILLQCIQPFAPLLADIVLVGIVGIKMLRKGFLLHQRYSAVRDALSLIAIGAAQMPLLIYTLKVFDSDSNWHNFSIQNITLSPPFWYYVFGFGFLWLFALFGAWRIIGSILFKLAKPLPDSDVSWAIQNNISETSLDQTLIRSEVVLNAALIWVAAALILAYSPMGIQRRFMHAFSLPLSILGTYGFAILFLPANRSDMKAEALWSRHGKRMMFLMLTIASLSTVYLSLGNALYLRQRPAALFESASLAQAVNWLAMTAPPGDLVLADESTSQFIVARTALKVYFGHPMETMFYDRKKLLVRNFYLGKATLDWLQDSQIDWMIFGPREKEMGDPVSFSSANLMNELQLAYQNSEVSIYRTIP